MLNFLRNTIAACLMLMPLSVAAFTYFDNAIQREGIEAKLSIESVAGQNFAAPVADQLVKLSITAKRLADQQPLDNWSLGAWLDLEISPLSGAVPVCGQRVAGFLSGNLLRQPLLDLTGYYVLTLDRESSISVLDPAVSFAGKSSLYSVIKLGSQGFDWLKTSDDTRLFVALPENKEVIVIDLQTLQIIKRLMLPGQPTRLALMPGERLLWVGQTGQQDTDSQLSVIDTLDGHIVTSLPLPKGHHEFAFSEQGKQVFVSNRDDGSILMLDGQSINVKKTWKIEGIPLSLAVTGPVLWISDAQTGRLFRYNLQGEPLDSIALKPGIGPLRLSPDQAFLFVLNPSEHTVFILDTQQSQLRQTLTISGRPYDVIFSEQFAYIRSLDSEQTALVGLNELKKQGNAVLKYIPIGADRMSAVGDLPIASSMSPALNGSGAFFAAPSEATVYHYMEGMNAPDSGIRTYGHTPMATLVVQRGLRQTWPGRYEAIMRLPSAGRMVLALASENPRFMECIGLTVKVDQQPANPADAKMNWLGDALFTAKSGQSMTLRVKTVEPLQANDARFKSLGIRIMPAAGGQGQLWPLKASSEQVGEFVANGTVMQTGSYYLHIVAEPPVSANFATLIVENP